MANEWYYERNGQQHGPVIVEKLKELAASGQLQPADLVWREGMAEWAQARKVKGLFPKTPPLLPGTPPPAPPPIPKVRSGRFSKRFLGLPMWAWGCIVGSVVLLGGILLTGKIVLDSQVLTEEFYPFVPGRKWRMDLYNPSFHGRSVSVLTEYTQELNNTIFGCILEMDQVPVEKSQEPELKEHFRIHSGFVEFGCEKDGDIKWLPRIKIGARKGDTWGHADVSYTLKGFSGEGTLLRPLVTAVIEEIDFESNRTPRQREEWVFARGVGLYRRSRYVIRDKGAPVELYSEHLRSMIPGK